MKGPLNFIEWRFYQSNSVTSRAIRWFGHQWPSHVDVVAPDNSLLGSYEDWVKPAGYAAIPPGVQKRPAYYARWTAVKALRLGVTALQYERFWDFMLGKDGKSGQLGTPYDKWHLIDSFVFGSDRQWRLGAAWWCSELQGAATEYGCIASFPKNIRGLTPGDFYIAIYAKGALEFDIPPTAPLMAA